MLTNEINKNCCKKKNFISIAMYWVLDVINLIILITIENAFESFKLKYLHCCSKLMEQPVLSLTSFVYNSTVNKEMKIKNMKLRENICYEMIH